MLEYLQQQYAVKGWPFFSHVELINKFGEEGRKELNELREQVKVRSRIGINGRLVELIINETI